MNFKRFTTTLLLIAFCAIPALINAQDSGFIYGTVTTIDNKTYTGAIRWGKEEVFWTDMFNASKEENENLRHLTRAEREDLDEKRYRENHKYVERGIVRWVSNSWSKDRYEHTHEFSVQFGEIKKIEITGRSRVYLTLQNGERIEARGEGYNDVGSSIKVLDQEIGEIKLSWSKIDVIEFESTPNSLSEKFGEPLYGTVQTYAGTFEGYVQWDHDERVSTDKLDGDTSDGDVSIRFGKIKSIENEGNRSTIVLNSGREMTLRGSNDVNSENRGIIVTSKQFGRVDIPWREFRRVTFGTAKEKLPAFNDFSNSKKIKGSVKTVDGNTFSGTIVYDLDEEFTMEVLQGKDEDIEYIIPFSKIKSISPKNYDYSNVKLTDGTSLTLGESQDVSDKNSGVLVFEGSKDPLYIPWEKIDTVNFN
ncbi:MAG: hypothetical protein AAFQ94_21850 [Bacteroidota bacterium]